MLRTVIQRRIIYNTVFQIVGKIASVGLGLITVSLLTRYLGVAGYGNFALVFTYLSLFGVIADFGLHLTLVREFTKETHQKKLATYFTVKLLLVGVSLAISLLALPFFPYSQAVKQAIVVGAFAFAMGTIASYAGAVLQSQLRLDLVSLSDIVAKVITVGTIILFTSMGMPFFAIVATVLVGNIAGLILLWAKTRRFLPLTFTVDPVVAKELLIASIPVGVTSLLSLLYFKIDTMMLSMMRSPYDVGIYSVPVKILENILVIWGMYMASIYPLFSKFVHAKDVKNFSNVFAHVKKIYLLYAGLTLLVGFAAAPLMIQILGGNEFADSVLPFRILLFSTPFFFMNNTLYHGFLAKENVKVTVYVIAGGLLANIGMNAVAIPTYGAVGASVVTIMTEMLVSVGYIALWRRSNVVTHS